jgi:hypothetical protein
MVFPKLLGLSSSDFGPGQNPADPENCVVQIVATIGPSGGSAGDNFSFTAVTPSALAENQMLGWGRGTLVVDSFSWPTVEKWIDRLLAHAARPSWQEVAQVLNHELRWEFDGYRTNDV